MRRIDPEHVGGFLSGGDPATWCPTLWQWLVQHYGIRSVLDIGCGEGHSTRFFQELGCDVLGVDGSAEAIRNTVVPGRVVLHDFTTGPFLPGRRFDMVWSSEFVEHVDPVYLDNVLQSLTSAERLIAMTHAFPGQPGHHHVNCQRNAYWIRHVESRGFTCLVNETTVARATAFEDYPSFNHFARSGLLFVRNAEALGAVAQRGWGGSTLSAALKAARIRLELRLSVAYWRQLRRRRRYHRQRRAERRQAAQRPAA